ncbi:conserved hypothetical protein [Sphingomonas sp. EC-HK361]|jgi:hypothetical protein|uniref:DUF3168 domain-containing protein n=1 Tax=Sphingomonas sp. EC-HK361 TaxID=2038397 RepID=UPI0012566759|nr:DUF3168 domain-containing protein [Sphingomonas sp. EC-HK361]VVT00353.1 conserved hypothetical protein [Sphingomonas sp. EC-HK361]
MSAAAQLQGAVVLALAGIEGLTGAFDAPPVRAALPHAVVDAPVTSDWSAKGVTGREARLTVRVVDGGERPARLQALAGGVEDAVSAIDGTIGEGWRVVAVRPVQTRIVRSGERWTASVVCAVRMYREET